MHRIRCTKLTPEQITSKLVAVSERGPASASPFSSALAGKSLQIVLDNGPALGYRFTGDYGLSLEGDAAPVPAGDGALTLDNGPTKVALFSHLVPRTQRGYIVAVDEDTGLDGVRSVVQRQTAASLMHCTVQIETAIGPPCPLVEMAREPGGGVVRRPESGVFDLAYVRCDGIWTIQRSTYRPT